MIPNISKLSWISTGWRIVLPGLAALLVAVACGSDTETDTTQPATTETEVEAVETAEIAGSAEPVAEMAPKIQVVTTTNFVADWVENIGSDRVEVFSLLPLGADPHSFQPGARDVAKIADADLVLTVGLGLEAGWLTELVHNANTDETKIVTLGDFIDPIEFEESGGHEEHEEEEEHGPPTGRLLIADGEQASVSVLDLTTEALDELSINVAAPASRLYTSPSGRFAFVLSRGPEDNDDRVQILDGGIYVEEHDGHMDLEIEPVSFLSLGTTDQRPVHVSIHHGWTAIFHDATGRVALFEEHDLEEERDSYEPIWLESGLQHGAGVPLGEGFVAVTTANPDYPETEPSSLPLGVEVRNLDGDIVYDESSMACPGMHGNGSGEHGVLFGCVGGVLFLEGHDGEYEHEFVTNHPDMISGARLGTIWGHNDSPNFFGSASYRHEGESVYDGLWLIDAEGGQMTKVLPSGETKRVLTSVFDDHGEMLFALTYDGQLNAIDTHTGEVTGSVDVVNAFDGDTSPSMIVVGELLYVSDRASGRIIEFSIDEGEIEREWAISGQPRSLAFVGVGAEEEHEEHDHGPLDPHFWFDPLRVQTVVTEIASRLSALDADSEAMYTANAASYNAELDELHTWTQQQVQQIEIQNRLLVTSHDSLSYFAKLYGFLVVGAVIPATQSTDVEPTAEEMTDLVHEIEENGVPAIFGETTVSERLAQAIAEETGAKLVRLYSGSLGPDGSGAETYIGMQRLNVERIVEALK